MFQSSPPELQGGMLVALHAAVAAAASTLADIVEADDPPSQTASSSTPPTAERINGAIACVQGAIQMYQSSPVPEAQGGMLLALHAAIAAAATTLGDMVNTEHDRQRTTTVIASSSEDEAVVAPAEPTTASPPPTAQSATPPNGTDENTVFLEGVYKKLKRAAGPGKMGLRDDFQDAESLLEDLNKMRMLLVEELETGIPESDGASVTSSRSSEGSAPSKYQEMLAKARADKAGK